jgi:hypothetical protein
MPAVGPYIGRYRDAPRPQADQADRTGGRPTSFDRGVTDRMLHFGALSGAIPAMAERREALADASARSARAPTA